MARAASTARSTSAAEPWAISASLSSLLGSKLGKNSDADGSRHAPSMKCPKRGPRAAIHARASSAASGAGPYSIDSNSSAVVGISLIFLVFLVLNPADGGGRRSTGP